jgi:hypothetical protein
MVAPYRLRKRLRIHPERRVAGEAIIRMIDGGVPTAHPVELRG